MARIEEIRKEAKLKCHDIANEVDYKSSAAYDGFVMGAKWADKTMIEKACEWITEHIFDFPWYDSESELSSKDIAEEIRKAMEE